MATPIDPSALSFYIHIPYCLKRCGYCDFNTYTPAELQIESSLAQISESYIDLMLREIDIARKDSKAEKVLTIFFGGGTPSLMEPSDLGRIVSAIEEHFGLSPDCEITLEANPDSLTKERLQSYFDIGINRLSVGMQSAVPHVLEVLDRTHNPENIARVVSWARQVGFTEISLDLIYGTPGESLGDWRTTVEMALSLDITHISAYALIVEHGTKLAAQVKRGEILIPDDDETAEKYLLADELISKAGMHWYELSNWSKPDSHSRHNTAYWLGGNWWGVGPGAHSHIDGRRWWNVKHPTAYRDRLLAKKSPIHESEILTAEEIAREKIMLLMRLPNGLTAADFSPGQIEILNEYVRSGDVDESQWRNGGLTLTLKGRLIADRIVRDLVF